MVSEVRYYSFKEIRFHHRHPFGVLLGLILLLQLTIVAPEVMLFLGIASYAFSGPVLAVFRRLRAAPAIAEPQPQSEPGPPGLRAIPKPGEGQGASLLDKPGARR
jgi:hypothetical protein